MAHEMRGAQLRTQRERALVWAGALLPYQKAPPSFEEFVGLPKDRSAYVREFEARWDKVDAVLRRQQ